MQLDMAKLENVVLYVCHTVGGGRLGAVKLHKVLYFSDMLFYAEFGQSITGSTYRKRPYGPTCDELLKALRSLERKGAVRIENVDYFGYAKKQYEANVVPDAKSLTNAELAIINEVAEFVCNDNSARTISEFSHNRAWENVEFGEIIKYNSVFSIFPTEVSQEAIEWAQGEAAKIADERSSKTPVARHDFGDFRNRVLQARFS